MNFEKIDLDNFKRAKLFKFYTTELPLVMNMTVEVDVTAVLKFAKSRGLRFYPTMMWVVARVINSRDEFKYSLTEQGELIRWDTVSPSYTDFNPETEEFVKFVTEYSEDLFEFHERVVRDCAAHKNECGFLPDQPKNIFDISCLPWVKYSSLALHINDGKHTLFPAVVWGKYEKVGDKFMMPVTMILNHAVGDGFHICRFFNDLERAILNLENEYR